MLKVAIFAVILVFANVYAFRRGQAPERIATFLMSGAFLATTLLPYNGGRNYNQFFVGLFIVDMILFLGLTALALFANRYWPMWAAALQLLTLAVHLVKAYDSSILSIVYARVSGEIGYLMVVMLIVGTKRLQERIKANGEERDWSPLRL